MILSLYAARTAQTAQGTIVERDGVYFRHMDQIAMGDSAWAVITNVNLNQVDKFIAQLLSELAPKQTRPTQLD